MLKSWLKSIFGACGYEISRKSNFQYFQFRRLLNFCMEVEGSLNFIQVGACDGILDDPIYQFVTENHEHVRGLVVEPLEDYFSLLKQNYASYPTIKPLNFAIHNHETTQLIYRVDPQYLNQLEEFAKGISSFDPDHHKRSQIESKMIITEQVTCMTINQLIQQAEFDQVHLLQVDTEGYDHEILMNIEYEISRPLIIRFEHGLQSNIMSPTEFCELRAHLHKQGYELILETSDAVAIHVDFYSRAFQLPMLLNQQKSLNLAIEKGANEDHQQ